MDGAQLCDRIPGPNSQQDCVSVPSPIGGILRRLRRFGRNRDGAVAVEFALVAIPFFGMIFALIQTTMIYFARENLQTAVTDVSRLVMTGQIQSQRMNSNDFRAAVCARTTVIPNCRTNLRLDVKSYPDFSSIPDSPPLINAAGRLDLSGFRYNTGKGGNIVIIRGVIVYPIIIPYFRSSFINVNRNNVLLVASAAFKNEPF